jgi:hypothetical protein
VPAAGVEKEQIDLFQKISEPIYPTPYLTLDFLTLGALYGLYVEGRYFLAFFVACWTLGFVDLGCLAFA